MKRGKILLLAVASVTFILFLSNCKDDVTGEGGSPSDIVFPTDSVSYLRHVQPLFNQTCALAGCHDDGPHQSPLKLTDYGSTIHSATGTVIPGDAQNSNLIIRIEGRVGARMPLNRNPLNQNQVTGLRTWIAEGARPQ